MHLNYNFRDMSKKQSKKRRVNYSKLTESLYFPPLPLIVIFNPFSVNRALSRAISFLSASSVETLPTGAMRLTELVTDADTRKRLAELLIHSQEYALLVAATEP